MKRLIHIIPAIIVILFITASPARAFFEEITQLKKELQLWEDVNAEDFSEVIEQLDDITGTVFNDIKKNDWFSDYVSALLDWKVVSGYSDSSGQLTGRFKPENYVTVAEILKMAIKAAKIDETKCDTSILDPSIQTHWASSFVACAKERNMRMFKNPGEISLDRPAKRAEVLTIIHDAFGDEILSVYSTFIDTKGHKYEADIAHAQLFGIISGDTDIRGAELGTFRPDDPINRAETAKIVYQRMKEEARKDLTF